MQSTQLGRIYTDVSDGHIGTLQQGLLTIAIFGATYLAAEGITIVRRVAMDWIVATNENEVRDKSFSKLLRMPVQ